MNNIKNFFFRRKNAYNRISESEDGKMFLSDLYKFCETRSVAVPNDPISTGVNIGKEMVAKHIKKILAHDDKKIAELSKYYERELTSK